MGVVWEIQGIWTHERDLGNNINKLSTLPYPHAPHASNAVNAVNEPHVGCLSITAYIYIAIASVFFILYCLGFVYIFFLLSKERLEEKRMGIRIGGVEG